MKLLIRNLIFSIILILSLITPSYAWSSTTFDPWTKKDLVLETIWITANICDAITTHNIKDQNHRIQELGTNQKLNYETNYLLGKHPDDSEINIYTVTNTLLHIFITNILPEKIVLNIPYTNMDIKI